MEFNYDNGFGSWSYGPTDDELKEAKIDFTLDTIIAQVKYLMNKKEFTEDEIKCFKVIAELIVDGSDFEWLNDESALYDEFKIYFYDKSKNIPSEPSLEEIEDEEYKIAKGMM